MVFGVSTGDSEASTSGFWGVDFDGVGDLAGSDPKVSDTIVRHHDGVSEDFYYADQIRYTATWIHELSNYPTLYPGGVLWAGTADAGATC